MITLIINIIVCVTGILLSLSSYKRYIQATEKLKRVTECEERMESMIRPPFSYDMVVDYNRSCVIVGAKYCWRGWFHDVNFKEFPFDPTDSEDKEFAIREAEELIEKLREK